MPRRFAILVLCLLALTLASCIPYNWLVFSNSGIIAETRLTGIDEYCRVESLSQRHAFNYLDIKYDEIDQQDSRLQNINLLFEDRGVNLAEVSFEEVASVNVVSNFCKKGIDNGGKEAWQKPCICFNYCLDDDTLVARIYFEFDKNKKIVNIHCYCDGERGRGRIKFENIADQTIFEMPIKVEELKALFGNEAKIYKSIQW